MQRKNCAAVPRFELKDRSNQELVDGVKHLVGRHRTVTAHLIAYLAEIHARKLHVVEGFSYLGDYCVSALGMSEDEAHRRAHAAVLAQKYPVILDMLLEGSIHLTTLRIIGKCLTSKNHRQVLEAARGKNKTELEHLAAALCPKPDVPTVLRKLPEPRRENVHSEEALFINGEAVLGAVAVAQTPSAGEILPDYAEMVQGPAGMVEATGVTQLEAAPAPPSPPKSRLVPLSPHRYNLQVTVDEETYNALKQLQDLLRHQVRNGDLAKIIKDSVLERLERVKREKFGHTKRPRKTREQKTWMDFEKATAGVSAAEKEPGAMAAEEGPAINEQGAASSDAIAPGRFQMNSRHIPAAVKREVWERDEGQCAFVSRSGRRCSEKGRLEFHHIHAYALGGPATVLNIALRCRTHNAHEGVSLFGEKRVVRSRGKGSSGRDGQAASSNRPGSIAGASSGANAP